jgi:hypothetical protein
MVGAGVRATPYRDARAVMTFDDVVNIGQVIAMFAALPCGTPSRPSRANG